jgi:DNA-directed RNA polymerase subunit RPC12/RpoP
MPPAKSSYVCLPCRTSYKLASYHRPAQEPVGHGRRCPRCARELVHVGAAFAPPPRRDTHAWRALSVVLNAGIRFHMGCCDGPGWRPRTLREVKERAAYARRTGEPLRQALLRRDL